MRGSAREIVLVNRDRKRAQGVVTDVQYGTALSPPIAVRDGDYEDLAGSPVVMITAGVNEKAGGATDRSDPVGRLRLLEANAAIFQDVVPQIHKFAPDALILVVSDPPDALADVVRMLGHERVLHRHISRHVTVTCWTAAPIRGSRRSQTQTVLLALFEVQQAQANSSPAKSELIFDKYGNHYFLTKLFDEGSSIGSQLLESRYEKRVGQAAADGQEHVPAHHAGN